MLRALLSQVHCCTTDQSLRDPSRASMHRVGAPADSSSR
jgi:hypothetical protein